MSSMEINRVLEQIAQSRVREVALRLGRTGDEHAKPALAGMPDARLPQRRAPDPLPNGVIRQVHGGETQQQYGADDEQEQEQPDRRAAPREGEPAKEMHENARGHRHGGQRVREPAYQRRLLELPFNGVTREQRGHVSR